MALLNVGGRLGVESVEGESEGDSVGHVDQPIRRLPLRHHVADIACLGDDAGPEGRVLPRLPADDDVVKNPHGDALADQVEAPGLGPDCRRTSERRDPGWRLAEIEARPGC